MWILILGTLLSIGYFTHAENIISLRSHSVERGLHAPSIKTLSWWVLVSSSCVNALFEELVVVGYAFNQIATKQGPIVALTATTLLRLSLHTWKNSFFFLGTGLQFYVIGTFYWRTRSLWPLIAAHASFDIFMMTLGKI